MPSFLSYSIPLSGVARLLLAAVLIVTMAIPLGGCRMVLGTPRDMRTENDRLRRENMELRREVEALNDQLEARAGELESLRRQLDRVEAAPMPDAEVPTLARLRMGRYSGGVDTTGDGVDDLIRVYLRPLDQRNRVLPVAGRAMVRAVALPPDEEPRLLAERTYAPPEFDRAWRSGFTGSHFTLELELPADLDESIEEVTVRVTFTQARTGVELTTQEGFRIRRSYAANDAEG